MRLVKASSTRNLMVFLVDSADHVVGKTGATLSITISKDGAAFVTPSPAIVVTERGNGWYNLALTAAETNAIGDLVIRATASGADPVDCLLQVVAFDPTDAMRLGLTALPNVNAGAAGGIITTAAPTASQNASAVRTELATELGRIDVAIGSRSSYTGADTAGTTTLLGRITDTRATKIDNLDGTITSRMPSGTVTVDSGSVTSIQSGLATSTSQTTILNAIPTASANASATWSATTRTLTDKTGFTLSSTGLDSVVTTVPTGVATTFPGKLNQVHARWFNRTQRTSTHIRVYQPDATTVATNQAWSNTSGVQEVGAPS